NPALFLTQPSVAPDGTLTYQPAQFAYGAANVLVTLTDSSGAANAFGPLLFHITIAAVNQPPHFTPGPDQAVTQGSGLVSYVVSGWGKEIVPGPAHEDRPQWR